MIFNNKYFTPYKDMYNHYNNITKVNNGYKLYFNKKDKYFYVINTAKNNEICLKTDKLSLNLQNKLFCSRVENSKKIFQEIDLHNENLMHQATKLKKENAINTISEISKYSKRTNHLSNNLTKIIKGEIC